MTMRMLGRVSRLTGAAAVLALAVVILDASVALGSAHPRWGAGLEAKLPANGVSNGGVQSVSCSSAGNCAAVGSYIESSGDTQAMMLSEVSGVWGRAVEAGLPAGSGQTGAVLGSVSCPSIGNCSAVGSYTESNFEGQGLAVAESSGKWGSGVQLPAPANYSGAGEAPSVVSCASGGGCVAVGSYPTASGAGGLLLSESKGSWGAAQAPLPGGDSPTLTSVSCRAAGDCTAVGYYLEGSDLEGLLLSESSGHWSATEAGLPSDGGSEPGAAVRSVACASAGNCAAVGDYDDRSGSGQGLLLSETKGHWSRGLELRLPTDARSDPNVELSSVSCPSVGNCSAAGDYLDTAGDTEGLLVSEHMGTWSRAVEARLPAGAVSGGSQSVVLESISCATPGDCAAVGSYVDTVSGQQGLLLSKYSGTWHTGLEAAMPAKSSPVSVESVSCASTDSCSAVGNYEVATDDWQAVLLANVFASASLSAAAPATGRAGKAIAPASVTGKLSGGAAPIGRITFSVFGPRSTPPSTCATGGRTVGTATVSGDDTYHPSTGFTPSKTGDYWWYAAYSGDATDTSSASSCGKSMPKTVVTG
jgi:hypothetical protein